MGVNVKGCSRAEGDLRDASSPESMVAISQNVSRKPSHQLKTNRRHVSSAPPTTKSLIQSLMAEIERNDVTRE